MSILRCKRSIKFTKRLNILPIPYAMVAIAAMGLAGCGRDEPPQTEATVAEAMPQESNSDGEILTPKSKAYYMDVTESLGFSLPTEASPDGAYLTPEITAGGVGVFDYNGDGRMDIYLVCHAPAGVFSDPAPNQLYEQQPDGRFQLVPNAGGLDDPGYGHGVAVGDIDNDGDLDVYVANYGPDAFYLNQGKGTFVNQTQEAGFRGDHWSSSAGFFDYDRDGDLDLYVVNFAVFDEKLQCNAPGSTDDPDFCGPHVFEGLLDTLYRNNGDGTFTDVTAEAGIQMPGRGWGLALADITGDGWADIFVANDGEPAQLWVNQHDGTFEEEAVFRGCAYNGAGRVEAGMGVGIADVDGDMRLDLFKSHIGGETNTLYVTGGSDELFSDHTEKGKMGAVDRPYTGWGCGFFDFNHDGHLDMAVANGRVSKGVPQAGTQLGRFWSRFAEPNLLFAGLGNQQFDNVSHRAGKFGSEPTNSRGMAIADIDNDGDLDLVVQHLDNSPRVYRNDAPPTESHWLMVQPMTGARDAYGAAVIIETQQGKRVSVAQPASSYLASNDPRAHFGLGTTDKVKSLEVIWPSGAREMFSPPEEVDRVVQVTEGEGTPPIE